MLNDCPAGTGPSPRVRGKRRRDASAPYEWRSIPACAGETAPGSRVTPAPPVHPRVCGGNDYAGAVADAELGPSPRVRGKRQRAGPRRRQVRSIPACAGETASSRGAIPGAPVHPRVCGGNLVDTYRTPFWTGPSPRVRGKRFQRVLERVSAGSIPACAGETSARRRPARSPRVHPRVCGGNIGRRPDTVINPGPSPRVRGKRQVAAARHFELGSIPACAGETSSPPASPPRAGVHPRVCGGNRYFGFSRRRRRGPSPRVRGKHAERGSGARARGSIPACAGETWRSGTGPRASRVHPRVCGGNTSSRTALPPCAGPSPRVRGKPGRPDSRPMGVRSIPACAGETPGWPPPRRRPPVHPRVCGGNFYRNVTTHRIPGPSPRVRGKLDGERGGGALLGSIPACAGETGCRTRSGRRPPVHPRVCGGNKERELDS